MKLNLYLTYILKKLNILNQRMGHTLKKESTKWEVDE